MDFSNTPNELITKDNIGERGFYHARSVAVLAVILAICDNKLYVLVERRGDAMDEPFKWCVPCGYVDWDETCAAAVVRETFEETNLNLNTFIGGNLPPEDITRPWHISDTPNNNRQNITFFYGTTVRVNELPHVSPVNVGPEEVTGVKWLEVSEMNSEDDNHEFAFMHDDVINDYVNLPTPTRRLLSA